MAAKKTSLYLTDDLSTKLRLSERRGLSEAINESIDRYNEIIDVERKRLISLFVEGEWNAMRNAANGTIWQPAAVIRGGMLANIQDSLDEELESFGAVRTELESKLKELSVAQQFALVEMVEEWWVKQSPRA